MLTIVVIILSFKKVFGDVNLALEKGIKYCDTKDLGLLMVDSNRNINISEKISESCIPLSYFDIYLGAEYYIHYVVVYEGLSNSHIGALDYFAVDLKNNKGIISVCSMYPRSSPRPISSKGMRLNCKNGKASYVRIKSNYNKGFSIAEIEIYTMASDRPDDDIAIYIGCFANLTELISKPGFGFGKNCLDQCRILMYPFAAFLGNNSCFCGNIFNDSIRLPLAVCNKTCGDYSCGGIGVYSVYIVHIQLPYYVGCFRGLSEVQSTGNMTVTKCFYKCIDHGYAALSNGQDCMCTHAITSFIPQNYTSCNISCYGSPDAICGGENHLSIYGLKSETINVKSLYLIRCNDGFDELAVCKSGCEIGYIGHHCIEAIRYCVDLNPCRNIQNSECALSGNFYECKCKNDFIKDSTTGLCINSKMIIKMATEVGLNVLKAGPCDSDSCFNISNSKCVSNLTGYYCVCKEGFIKTESNDCEDIDECVFEPCDTSSSMCFNNLGSYTCKCKLGFYAMSDVFCGQNATVSESELNDMYVVIYFLGIPLLFVVLLAIISWKIGKHIEITIPSETVSESVKSR